MVNGLRLGLAAQYFARKPPHSLEKLIQKMDEYIRADNDFLQRREEFHRHIKSLGALEEGIIRDMSKVSITHHKARKRWLSLRAS